jgi:NADH-quinone oxidoreductase subunit C
MHPLTFPELQSAIEAQFGPALIESADAEVTQPWLQIEVSQLASLCQWLRDEEALAFDFLHNLSGVDYGESANALGVVYHLSSLLHEHQLVLKVRLDRASPAAVPSLADIWRAADWHEREAYDLLGIPFTGHPDLRRILMPADWEGHPLRKDYQTAEHYHEIPIDYQDSPQGNEELARWQQNRPEERE